MSRDRYNHRANPGPRGWLCAVQNPTQPGPSRGLYFHNAIIGSITNTAEYQAARVIDTIRSITGNLKKINLISGNTCSQIQKIFRVIEADSLLQYSFMIPCDAHGLQLLLGDILDFPPYYNIIKAVNAIVNHLIHANK
jgi:hypothetical protein